MSVIYIVEDDISFAGILNKYLTKQGYEVIIEHNCHNGILGVTKHNFDLALIDYRLPDGNGVQILQEIRRRNPLLPAIIMTSLNDIRLAVKAMKSGAYDYITKPINQDELSLAIKEALKKNNSGSTIAAIKKSDKSQIDKNYVKGSSPATRQLHQYLELVGPTEMAVLITGESGTGKEYAARMIHKLSSRCDQPFHAVDCGTLTPELAGSELFGHVKGAFTGAFHNKTGIFQIANTGTVFLDEIGNLSYEVQLKLLRFMQERTIVPIGSNQSKQVDVRIIAATNENLYQAVREGNFREDLYHRINEFTLHIPPLRERLEDFDEFFKHFLRQSNIELNKQIDGIEKNAKEALLKYHWPGNVREFKNVIKRAVLLSQTNLITTETLPFDLVHGLYDPPETGSNLKEVQAHMERDLILKTLHNTKFNKSKTAKLLNIDRKTLYNKLKRYGLDI